MALIPMAAVGPCFVLHLVGRFKKKPAFILHQVGTFKRKPVREYSPEFKPSVTAVIPAKNEMKNILYSLASLNKQTYKPGEVYVMDDASSDATPYISKLFGHVINMNIEVRTRDKCRGKTSSIKEITRESNSDLIFVLDADTILDSKNYLERLVETHYHEKVLSACGIVKPITKRDRVSFYERELADIIKEIIEDTERGPNNKITKKELEKINPKNEDKLEHILRLPAITYRKGLYNYVQKFLNNGEQGLFNTTLVPVGCGVLYNRKKLRDLFDEFEEKLGDNLTNSEDIFIGFSICNDGYFNVQLKDIEMSTTEPKITHLMKQTYLWESGYLQSSYYFSNLVKTPFNYFTRKKEKINPIGWVNFLTIAEKITYPSLLASLGIFVDPWLIPLTVAVEHGIYITTNLAVAPKGKKLGSIFESIISFPIKVAVLIDQFYAVTRFGYDLVTSNRNWTK